MLRHDSFSFFAHVFIFLFASLESFLPNLYNVFYQKPGVYYKGFKRKEKVHTHLKCQYQKPSRLFLILKEHIHD